MWELQRLHSSLYQPTIRGVCSYSNPATLQSWGREYPRECRWKIALRSRYLHLDTWKLPQRPNPHALWVCISQWANCVWLYTLYLPQKSKFVLLVCWRELHGLLSPVALAHHANHAIMGWVSQNLSIYWVWEQQCAENWVYNHQFCAEWSNSLQYMGRSPPERQDTKVDPFRWYYADHAFT